MKVHCIKCKHYSPRYGPYYNVFADSNIYQCWAKAVRVGNFETSSKFKGVRQADKINKNMDCKDFEEKRSLANYVKKFFWNSWRNK